MREEIAAPAGVAVRRHQARGRASLLPVPREPRRAVRLAAVLHRVRTAAAAGHGISPLHPGGADRPADQPVRRRRTRRAISRSWPTPSRRRMAAGDRGRPGAVYNIGGGSRVSVNQVLDLIGRLTGRTLDIRREADAEGRHARHVRRYDAGPDRSWASRRLIRSRRGRGRVRLAGAPAGRAFWRTDDRLRFPFVVTPPPSRPCCASCWRALAACGNKPPLPPPGSVDADKFLFDRGTEDAREARSGSPRASISAGSSTPTRAASTARTPSSASATPTSARAGSTRSSWPPTSSASS